MAITYTSNKDLQVPAYADINWNVPVDINWTALDQMGGSSFPISVSTGGTTTLTGSTPATSNVYWYSAQQFTVTATGTLTSNAVITLPANLGQAGQTTMGGAWIVVNGITTAQSQTAFSITALPAVSTSTFTIGTTSPIAGTIVVLSTTGVLPGGFSANVEYYVVSPVATTFSLAATSGGTAITATSTSPYLGTALATAKYTLTVKPASGTGVIIQPETKGYVYYNGTSVNFADDNVIKTLSSVNGTFTVNGPLVTNNTITASETVTISSTNTPDLKIGNIVEDGLIAGSGVGPTYNYDVLSQSVWLNTTTVTQNFTINIRGNSNVALSSVIPNTGDLVTCVYIATCGATAYYCSAVQVDGTTTGVTTNWQNGVAPTSGVVSSKNTYTFTVFRTGTSTYTVLASLVSFA
jgi:hypothetical protein